jgi:uncharacterized DUF497 family protein
MGYIFEWSTAKAEANYRKHGVTFDEASTVFRDPLAMLMPDPDHSLDEQRFVLVGVSGGHRLLVVAFVEREPYTRLITARCATRRERKRYEDES